MSLDKSKLETSQAVEVKNPQDELPRERMDFPPFDVFSLFLEAFLENVFAKYRSTDQMGVQIRWSNIAYFLSSPYIFLSNMSVRQKT